MSKHFKLFLIAFFACTSGTLAHAKLHRFDSLPEPRVVSTGKASWYSRRSPGIRKRTANNEIFNDEDLTCAMWGVPFNQHIKVTNVKNGRSVVVRVNDRGPHKRYVRKGRVIDLSKEAFNRIGSLRQGLIEVELEFL